MNDASYFNRMIIDKLPAIIFMAAMATVAGQSALAQIVSITNDAIRYEFHGERVYDKQTNLSWMRCSVGQKWRAPDRCLGKPKGFTF